MAVLSEKIHNHKELCRTTLKSGVPVSWFIFSAIVFQIVFLELFTGIISINKSVIK